MKDLIRRFENPGSEYRGKPFWAWNGALEESELRRQIRIMRRMGLGGFFMHSRVGLATPYLSSQWFDLVRGCVDEARKWNMEAWLYDEDRWPSGAAGGLVTQDPRFRLRRLRMSIHRPDKFKWEDGILSAYAAEVKGTTARNLTPIIRDSKIPSSGVILSFRKTIQPLSSWYNGYTYLDTLSEAAVQKFIEVTHEKYLEAVGSEFGNVVPGIFTDEPNYGEHHRLEKTEEGVLAAWEFPWTDSLPQVFEKQYDYSILEHLPELFLDVDGIEVSRARYHYHDCITALFVKAFAKGIGDWCGSHRLMMTGHALCEETLSSQTFVTGSAMRFYEYMQAPGIDNLTENNYEFDTAKQCSSVAHQMGRTWVLSELYGCTGWDFPFEGHKADGNWQAVLGVNLRCPHLAWYTMAGEAKRDYPASIFFQSPWWQHYSKVEDYFARINTVLHNGKAVQNLLVIHPIESMWLRFRVDHEKQKDIQSLDRRIQELRNWLLEAHLDFDYGDEEILSRCAGVTAGPSGAILGVGKAQYHAVVVPPLLTIRATTLRLLRQFREKGGLVIFAGDPPRYVDAIKDRNAVEIAQTCTGVPFTEKAVVDSLNERVRLVSIMDQDGNEIPALFYQLREDEDAWYLFIVNNDRKNGYDATIRTEPIGAAEEWDPETGNRYAAVQEKSDRFLTIRTDFPPTGSRLFVIRKKGRSSLPPRPEENTTSKIVLRNKRWDIQLNEPNVLVLDRPKYRIKQGAIRGPEEILRVDQKVRKSLGIPIRGGMMMQPWAQTKQDKGPSAPIELIYTITVHDLPTAPPDLAVERPVRFEISFNGFPVDSDSECGWWVDPCLRRLTLDPSWFRLGENTLVLKTDYGSEDGLEAMFLLGDFGVKVRGTQTSIETPVRQLTLGDWTNQGLPFYCASVIYSTQATLRPAKNRRIVLAVPEWKGCCIRVLVNGQDAGIIAWQPHEIDITPFVKSGTNDIRIELITSRRNAFGPLHQANPENKWTGPFEFITSGDRWTEEYNLKPHGLFAPPVIEMREPVSR